VYSKKEEAEITFAIIASAVSDNATRGLVISGSTAKCEERAPVWESIGSSPRHSRCDSNSGASDNYAFPAVLRSSCKHDKEKDKERGRERERER